MAKTSPCLVSKSFLHVGDVVVWRQDIARTRVSMTEPLGTQIFDLRRLLQDTLRIECAFQTPESNLSSLLTVKTAL